RQHIRGTLMAPWSDLGIRPRDRRSCLALDGFRRVRCPSAAQHHSWSSRREPALCDVADRQCQWLDREPAQLSGEETDAGLFLRQFPHYHVRKFPYSGVDRCDAGAWLGPHHVFRRLAVREYRSRGALVRCLSNKRTGPTQDWARKCTKAVQAFELTAASVRCCGETGAA